MPVLLAVVRSFMAAIAAYRGGVDVIDVLVGSKGVVGGGGRLKMVCERLMSMMLMMLVISVMSMVMLLMG